jgi:tetratricopeptide (TPR) repeat protein
MDKYLDFVKTLDETRESIKLLCGKKQYVKSIAALTSFLEELLQEDENDTEVRYNIWFVHKRLSFIYCLFKKHEDAMNEAKLAMRYQNNVTEYYYTVWLMALIQETTNKKRAIKLYDKCIFYYSRTKQEELLMTVVRNKTCLIALSNNNYKLIFWIDIANTFNNTANILEYIHNNTYNIALNIIDKLIDLTSYRVAFATL